MEAAMNAQTQPGPLVVEVSDGHFNQLHRVERFPCRIGRAVDNDLVLSGHSVSPHHAELRVEDGRLAVEDLGSDNGTHLDGRRLSGTVAVPEEGGVLRLGAAYLTLRTPATPLHPTRRSGCQDLRTCLLLSWPAVIVLTLVIAVAGALESYLTAVSRPEAGTVLGAALGWALNVFAWGAVLAAIARVATRRAEWRGNLVLAALLIIVLDIAVPMVADVFDYVLVLDARVWVNALLTALLTPLILIGFARAGLGFGRTGRRSYAVAGFVLGVLFAVLAWADERDGFRGPTDHFHAFYDSNLPLHDVRIADDMNLVEFTRQARRLRPTE
ncbi:MAG: FHA domain-containing protein [Gammaproteobacteria bacterium]